MSAKQDRLEKCITEFVSGIINGSYFEQVYSDIFDFEDEEVDVNYFGKIRDFLEHFSPYDSDLNKHPQFYINEEQLREKIIALKNSASK